MSTNTEKVTELRERGNECVRAGNYAEAIIHYSHAIKIESSSPQLYSNRSYAFLKLQQYYHALEDANEAIRLDPGWAKGYFRRGEVEFATSHFAQALESYRRASQLQNDPTLLECVLRANREMTRQQKVDQQTPWVGAGIGLILGVLVVVGDAIIAKEAILTHPVLQSVVTIVFSLLGLGLGFGYRMYIQNQRKSLLEPPLDFLGVDDGDARNGVSGAREKAGDGGGDGEERRHHPRYNKAQARHRYKKGKS
ncbi:small glutamine-rich tetratricopeptide repeat-containing protein beta [Procambarus clarkii]|uniref:small glutamine-rich tetratricopeptide repeat-containing protein beta n=1 Tax=Procambarus clarkii TaxID=6728 RepID=UPI003742B112